MIISVKILSVEENNIDRLKESFTSGMVKSIYMEVLPPGAYVFLMDSFSDWTLFLYGDEYLSQDLALAIDNIKRFGDIPFDVLSMYSKREAGGTIKYFLSPRMFRNTVILEEGRVYPKDVQELRTIALLDGFILGNAK